MHICLMTRTTLEHIQGGSERHAADLCRGLAARGHRITIITTRHPKGLAEITTPAIRTLFLPHAADRAYTVRWWRESARAFARLHAADPVDIVWSQGIGAYGYLRLPARERPTPCAVILHGTPVGEWRAMQRLWRGSGGGPYRRTRFALRTWLFGRMFRAAAQRSDAVICVSAQLASDAAREFGIPAAKVTLVPNGVDTDRFAPNDGLRQALRSHLGISDDDVAILTAGRLERAKGHHLALQAAAALAEKGLATRVLIAGSGPDEDWLRDRAAPYGLSNRTHWLGHVPHDQMPAVYNAADVVLVLSLHTEAFPYAVAEPMACGRPVVASEVGGIVSLVAHGDNGFLVPPGAAEPAAAIAARLARDSALRARIGQAARQTILARFTLERMVTDTEQVFLRLVAERGTHP